MKLENNNIPSPWVRGPILCKRAHGLIKLTSIIHERAAKENMKWETMGTPSEAFEIDDVGGRQSQIHIRIEVWNPSDASRRIRPSFYSNRDDEVFGGVVC
ncbi:hypothetical protein RHS04_01879 [Rhizoctonia solani]|uniref:Uncharacterized protein n=1 Tax=Rhizoctonia solani TaxID=456999 RepID=A0A8H7HDW8_9AGAM|nr:hypothetical protein RHS04_01879 [Rhizoctonia solani]